MSERTPIAELEYGPAKTTVAVRDAVIKTTGGGDPFLSFEAFDATGSIKAIQFDADVLPALIVEVDGTVEDFKGRKQFKATTVEEVPDAPAEWFERRSHLSESKLEQGVRFYMERCGEYAEFVGRVIGDRLHRYVQVPAADRNHHAYTGGLAEHTLSMCSRAARMLPLHPELDAGLVYAGILLHDAGKMLESEREGFAWVRTKHRDLVGHIVWCCCELARVNAPDKLIHVVAAHHGRKEWGSPVTPATPEAWFVHQLDLMDSKMQMVDEAMPDEGSSEYVRTLGGRLWRT